MGIKKLIEDSTNISVLYVEHDYDVQSNKIKLLQKVFPNIVLTHNAAEALELYLNYKNIDNTYFDLVITELDLPETSGLTMINRIKEFNKNQRTLIIAEDPSSQELINLIEMGIDGFLPKPFNISKCINILEKIVERINFTKQRETHLSFVDNLTGLQNRSALLKQLEEDDASTIMIIDVDTLEHVNLIYGYEVGNIVLKEFSDMLKRFCKDKECVLYRVDNETFVIYDTHEFINFTAFENAFNELMDLTKYYKVKVMGVEIDFDITMGIVMCQDRAFAKANLALTEAKKEKKKHFTYHNEFKEKEPIEYRMKWRESVKHAIYDKKIVPFYQPIVNANGDIIKYEALMRMIKDDGNRVNYISPVYFLDIAIKTKQYEALSNEMLRQVFEALKDNDKIFSINVSYYDIKEINLLNTIKEFIKDSNSDICSRLVIELLETSNVSECEYCTEFLSVAKEAGIKIAIDDFGTGYSNFSHILNVEPDYLKIDGSLIKNIHTDENSLALVKAIVEFSKKLDIKLIAEFVHNKEVFDVVKNLGIDEFQGYYFGEPTKDIE